MVPPVRATYACAPVGSTATALAPAPTATGAGAGTGGNRRRRQRREAAVAVDGILRDGAVAGIGDVGPAPGGIGRHRRGRRAGGRLAGVAQAPGAGIEREGSDALVALVGDEHEAH